MKTSAMSGQRPLRMTMNRPDDETIPSACAFEWTFDPYPGYARSRALDDAVMCLAAHQRRLMASVAG
jgi:hypothetical protein